LSDVAEIVAVTFRQTPSGDLTFSDLIELAKEIDGAFDSGSDGVVITQGTDTIDETSFALDLLVHGTRPVVVTGAMRNPSLAGADGPANILASVRVASSRDAAGLGTLVVFNDEIHAARFVRKTNTSSPSTFHSPTCGPLGWVVEDRTRIVFGVAALATIAQVNPDTVPEVALVKCSLGDDARFIDQIASLGYAGAVIEGFGGGHVPARLVAALEKLSTQMPVVLASRTGSGEILKETYGFAGSERDTLSRGLFSAGALDGTKARVLLSLVLSSERDPLLARAMFERVVESINSSGRSSRE
jgi:L-asparaginase